MREPITTTQSEENNKVYSSCSRCIRPGSGVVTYASTGLYCHAFSCYPSSGALRAVNTEAAIGKCTAQVPHTFRDPNTSNVLSLGGGMMYFYYHSNMTVVYIRLRRFSDMQNHWRSSKYPLSRSHHSMNIRNSCLKCLLQVNMEIWPIQAMNSNRPGTTTRRTFRQITLPTLDGVDLTNLKIVF